MTIANCPPTLAVIGLAGGAAGVCANAGHDNETRKGQVRTASSSDVSLGRGPSGPGRVLIGCRTVYRRAGLRRLGGPPSP
ncbi:MAG: hypothetical protein MZV70_08010 [Desulfobacterales bacterium]|nr:hypothetical protein [Desulfobacterales bacterium]